MLKVMPSVISLAARPVLSQDGSGKKPYLKVGHLQQMHFLEQRGTYSPCFSCYFPVYTNRFIWQMRPTSCATIQIL